jgi:predicted nucleotidyltransferase
MITYEINKFGLREKDMDFMLRIFESIPTIEKVILYGSRATGTYERGSDVDIAISGQKISEDDISKINLLLEENKSNLLSYTAIHYETIKAVKLKEQIDKYGKVIYQKDLL